MACAQHSKFLLDGVNIDAPLEIVYDCFDASSGLDLTGYAHCRSSSPLGHLLFKAKLEEVWPVAIPSQWDNYQDYLTLYQAVRKTGLPNYLQAKVPIPSGHNMANWRNMLSDYPAIELIDFLEFGWPIDYAIKPIPTYVNHASEQDVKSHVLPFVVKECNLQAMIGPFDELPFKDFQVSPTMTR